MSTSQPAAACPLGHSSSGRDDRKSAGLADQRVRIEEGATRVGAFEVSREILRSRSMKQAGAGADEMPIDNPEHISVFFLDGDLHRRRRAAIARFFTPKAIATRYRRVMEETTDALIAGFRQNGRGRLDQISFQLAVNVAADIVGLTNSNQAAMARRIRGTLGATVMARGGWIQRFFGPILSRWHGLLFFFLDVKPAIAARRGKMGDDIISHLLEEGYSDKAVLIECMTYAAAGMVTTREFIVMVTWHLLEKGDLRAAFLEADEAGQIAILEEILRLEPIASLLYRRAEEDSVSDAGAGHFSNGELFALDIRAANTDEAVTGPCPFQIDPERASRMKVTGSYMSFGDGTHRCPGSQVALQETRVFIDRLMRVPGIRLAREPMMTWCEGLMSYELRNAIITCDRNRLGGS